MQQVIKILITFLQGAFGFIVEAQKYQKDAKGQKVKNEILENQLKRGDRVETLLGKTVREGKDGRISFDYSDFRK